MSERTDGSSSIDPNAAMMQMLANLSDQLAQMNEQMVKARSRSPVRTNLPESSHRSAERGQYGSAVPPPIRPGQVSAHPGEDAGPSAEGILPLPSQYVRPDHTPYPDEDTYPRPPTAHHTPYRAQRTDPYQAYPDDDHHPRPPTAHPTPYRAQRTDPYRAYPDADHHPRPARQPRHPYPPVRPEPPPYYADEEPYPRPYPPPPQQPFQPDVKLTPPTFAGRVDPEAYLDWERRMEHIFEYYNYSDPRKVALAAAQFTENALTWWDREVADRIRHRYGQITVWEDLKHVMRGRFVPPHFTRELQKRFRRLTQGSRSVEEYFEEFEHLRNRLECEDSPEALMAQFLDGLQERIARKVERQPYRDLGELLHIAIQIEQQNKRKFSNPVNRVRTNWNVQSKQEDRYKGAPSDTRFKNRAQEAPNSAPITRNRPEPTRPPIKPNTPSAPPTRTRDIVCFKCKGHGHISRECPNQRAMILTPSGDYESEDEVEETASQEDEVIEYPDSGEMLMMRRVLNSSITLDETE